MKLMKNPSIVVVTFCHDGNLTSEFDCIHNAAQYIKFCCEKEIFFRVFGEVEPSKNQTIKTVKKKKVYKKKKVK